VNENNKNSHYVNLIYNRLKTALGIHTDSELADRLGIKQTTLSMQRKRGTIDLENLINHADGIDLNWLFNQQSVVSESNDDAHILTTDQPSGNVYTTDHMVEELMQLRKTVKYLEEQLTDKNS
jgi:transcriptional regulator with XRE-family HTH domain